MSLKNIKIKGQSYNHPFTDLAQPLDDKLKAIEEGRWDDLIESHMRLGCSIAGRYVSIGGNSDEMVSAAMLGICVAVDKIKKHGLDHDNATGYIVHYIHNYCSEVLRKDTVVPMPRGQKIKPVQILTDNLLPVVARRRGTELNEDFKSVDYTLNVKKDDFDVIEFEDILEKIIKTLIEGKIILYRRHGWTDALIAKKLDISQPTVTRIRHTLFERYQKCCSC